MPTGKEGIISETGNWNVASDYSRLLIMKHLYLADEYETIAMFGSSDMLEDLTQPYDAEYLKVNGLKWFVHHLIKLVNNSKFAVKSEKGILMGYLEELKKIERILPMLHRIVHNSVRKTTNVQINYKLYDAVLERLSQLKSLINEPLNKNHLIFTSKETFDAKEFKKTLRERMISKG